MNSAMVDLRTSKGIDCNTMPLCTSFMRCIDIRDETNPSNSNANMGCMSAMREPRDAVRTP